MINRSGLKRQGKSVGLYVVGPGTTTGTMPIVPTAITATTSATASTEARTSVFVCCVRPPFCPLLLRRRFNGLFIAGLLPGGPTGIDPGRPFGIDRRPWFAVRGAGLKMAQMSPGRADFPSAISPPSSDQIAIVSRLHCVMDCMRPSI